MKQKYLRSNAFLGVLLLTFAAAAVNADGFSIGMSGTRADTGFKDDATTIAGDTSGYRVFGSYMFNERFGIEGGLSKYGSPNDKALPSNMHVDTESYDLYAVYVYPISPNFGLVNKVGFASWDTETEVSDENEGHYKSTDLALSFGGQYDLNQRFGIRGEIEWFDSAISGSMKYSLSGVFRFD